MEVIAIIIAVLAAVMVVGLAFKVNEEINRVDSTPYLQSRKISELEIKTIKLEGSLRELRNAEGGSESPYEIFVSFQDFGNNKLVKDVVKHKTIRETSDTSDGMFNAYVENGDEILCIYKKGDKDGEPSVKIRLEDYVSIEVIKGDK